MEQELKHKFNWWAYLQISDLFKNDKAKFGFMKRKKDLEIILLDESSKIILKLYKLILEWYTADKLVKEQMIKWSLNTNTEITMDQHRDNNGPMKKSIKISTCVDLQENSYKLIYTWHMTPKKLAKIYRDSLNKCWKCKQQEGSFYHQWWTCSKTKEFWTSIHKWMQKILKITIVKRPELFLLGINLEQFQKEERTAIWYMLVAAKITYARDWEMKKIP